MQLSVVIPTLNEERYLPKLLNSLKKQNFKDYEVVVADAGSKDKTIKIAQSFACQVVKGGLPAVGRNQGARVAQGEWILFLDADVVLDQDDFLLQALERLKIFDLDCASFGFLAADGSSLDSLGCLLASLYGWLFQFWQPRAVGFCILVKRKWHKKIGGFNEKLVIAEDHDYVQRLVKARGKFKFFLKPSLQVSIRRLTKEGRLKLLWKYFLSELHIIFKGPIYQKIFDYQMGGHYPASDGTNSTNQSH